MSRMLATQPATEGSSCRSVSTSCTQHHEPSAFRKRHSTVAVPTARRPAVEHGVAMAGDVVGVDEVAAGGADEVVGVVAEAAGGRTGVGDVTGGVEHEGDVGRTLHEGAEALFRLHERVAGLDQLGDVAGDLGDTHDRAGGVEHR